MEISKGSVLAFLTLNYPLLSEVNVGLNMPIAVITNKINLAKEFHKKLLFGHEELPLEATTSHTKVAAKLLSHGSAPVLFYYGNTEKSAKTVEFLLDACTTGSTNGRQITTIPIVVFKDAIPPNYAGRFFEVFLDEQSININSLEELLIAADTVPAVLRKVSEENAYDDNAALSLLPHFLPEHISDGEREAFNKCVKELIDANENAHDIDGVLDAVINMFYTWIENHDIKVWALRDLSNNATQRIDTDFYVYGNDLYIAERQFASIVAELTMTVPINVVKRQLCEDGVMVKASGDRYVFHMNYRDSEHKEHSKRMMKFKADRMKVTGKPTVVELCGGVRK